MPQYQNRRTGQYNCYPLRTARRTTAQANCETQTRRRRKTRQKKMRAAALLIVMVLLLSAALAIPSIIGWFSGREVFSGPYQNRQKNAPVLPAPAANEREEALAILKGYAEEYPQATQLLANPDAYPAALLALAARNPEAIGFALGWPTRNTDAAIDIAQEVQMGGIPLFLQWDARWGYRPYGSGMIALDGCGPVCLSMVAVALTGNSAYHPAHLADLSAQQGWLQEGSGTAWELMTEGAPLLGLSCEEVPLDENSMRTGLAAGKYLILSVRPGDFTTTGHFVVVTGTGADGDFTVHDPNSILRSEAAWPYDTLAPQIKNIWAFGV